MTMTMERKESYEMEFACSKANIAFDAWTVTTKEDDAFYGTLCEISEKSNWMHGIKSSDIRVVPLEQNPLLMEDLGARYNVSPELIWDTMENTKLMLEVDGTFYPLRTSAMKSMLETAKISGNALYKVKTEQLAEILNYCMAVAKGKSLLLVRAGKASAVLSSEARGYGILPLDQLYKETKNAINRKFGSSVLVEGNVSHEYLKAFFKLPKNHKALEEYKDFVDSAYDLDAVEPGIILRSSDVGMAAATLEPVFICKDKYWKIGNADKLHHKPGNTIESFQEMAATSFSKLDKTIEKFMELSKIEITHPHNAFMLACKKAKLPKKLTSEALEEFSMMVAADDISNAHDVYLGITEILFYAKRDGMSSLDISYIDDNVSKILNFNWSELDLPGEHSW